MLLACGAVANAQSSAPAEAGSVSDATSLQGTSSANTNDSGQEKQEDRPQAAAKPGNVVGTILDQTGSVAPGAAVLFT